jgi:DNA-binding NtrC family response regulator
MNKNRLQVLLVDDDPDFTSDFLVLLPGHMDGHAVTSSAEARDFLLAHDVDVVFLDIRLGTGQDGLEFLEEIKDSSPYLPVIMITADQQIATVVKAMRLGASDYVSKSPNLEKLKIAVDRAIAEARLRQRCDLLESELDALVGDLVGESRAMTEIKAQMKRLAEVSSTVLITGQSGTGKELVARGIHRLSPQRNQPFIAVNCPVLSRELIESELFGHERGAFTGAINRRIGKFEEVGPGTLFLDEITEIPPDVQAKLLRVLQEREFERVGGNRLLRFEGRILASTNRDIDQALAAGKLREDLLYRLRVTHVHLPPLADRPEDILILVDHFVALKAKEMKKTVRGVTPEAMHHLCSYNWPGNVRDLENCIENAIVYTDREILDTSDFGRPITSTSAPGSYDAGKAEAIIQFQRRFISTALRKNGGNLTQTAAEMGVTRQGLVKMMEACGLKE